MITWLTRSTGFAISTQRYSARGNRLLTSLGEQRLQVERRVTISAGHSAPRAVAVELDAVPVGILQVDRLADAVIGGADPDARIEHGLQCLGERLPVGVADRDVVEPGRPGGGGEPPFDSQVFSAMWWW